MPREYTKKKEEYLERGYSEKDAKRQAAIWFFQNFGITVREAHTLTQKGQWGDYKERRKLKLQRAKHRPGWKGDRQRHSAAKRGIKTLR